MRFHPAADVAPATLAELRRMQTELAAQVDLRDHLPGLPQRVAGVDSGFEDEGRTTRSVAVLVDGPSLQPCESTLARLPTALPYIPGLLRRCGSCRNNRNWCWWTDTASPTRAGWASPRTWAC